MGEQKTLSILGPEDGIKTISSKRFPGLEVLQKVPYEEANNAYEVWQVSSKDKEVEVPFIEHHDMFCTILVARGSIEMKIGNDISTANYKDIVHAFPYMPVGMTFAKDTKALVIFAGDGVEKGIDNDIHDPGMIVAAPWADTDIGKIKTPDDYVEHFRLAPFYYMNNMISPNETGGLYQLELLNIETSKNMPPGKPMLWDQHFHKEHCETFMVLEGSVIFGDEKGQLHTLQPGYLCHAPSPCRHTLMVKEDSICASACNPPDYQMKINQIKTMMKYHLNIMFEPEFVDFQGEWDKKYEHHGISKEYSGEVESVEGTLAKVRVNGNTEVFDFSPNYFPYEPEKGHMVNILGTPETGGTIIVWKGWQA